LIIVVFLASKVFYLCILLIKIKQIFSIKNLLKTCLAELMLFLNKKVRPNGT
jgi:hypothetical protein